MPEYGMNIDPNHPNGRPDPAALKGMKWVRMVFNAEQRPGESLGQLCAFYGAVIDAYAREGMRTLLILNHQITIQLRRPHVFEPDYASRFAEYTGRFVDLCQEIARKLSDKQIAYEIWNEQDQASESAIGIPVAQYKPLLAEACRKIRAVDPKATLMNGGLVSSTPVEYLLACRDEHHRLPVDAVALHPYTRFYNTAGLGTELNKISKTFSSLPLWLTEFHDGGLAPDIHTRARDQLVKFDAELPKAAEVAIWYCWSDRMNPGFGIVDEADRPKQPVYGKYFELAARGTDGGKSPDDDLLPAPEVTPREGRWTLVKIPGGFVNLRTHPDRRGKDIGDLHVGDEVTMFSPEVNGWAFVKGDNKSGWVSLQAGAVKFEKIGG